MRRHWIKIALGVLLVMQLVPYGRNHSNPPPLAEPMWDSIETRDLFMRYCADCHSSQTRWPWYSHVAPISWLVQHDVNEGREHFNVSVWGLQEKNDGDEAAEAVEEGEMPLWIYTVGRADRTPDDLEKAKLIRGLEATFGREEDDDDEVDEEDDH